jgi:hypothetical protein
MVMKAHGEVVIDRDVSDKEEMPLLKDASDDCVMYLVKGKELVVKRALSLQVNMRDLEEQ